MRSGGSGRIANVAAAAIAAAQRAVGQIDASPLRLAQNLGALFEEVLWVGADPPRGQRARRAADVAGPAGALRDLASALAAAACDRVLVIDAAASPPPELLLALVAWPEADVVVLRVDAAAPFPCAVYRRASALSHARALLAEQHTDVSALLEGIGSVTAEIEAPFSTHPPT
ncbi:MAG: hypothetical protein OEM49_02905 [Myxococcales bacterium]|nr:hypothetical protein [Myxococcales bacterium]MDH5306743.1 hypothetical protein [Myxococcales bacterium]MDH5565953.1 hypothetical protein [Myxococcales bacterium]